MRELDLAAIEQQLAEPLRILVAGGGPDEARHLAELLFGEPGSTGWSVAVAALSDQALKDHRPGLLLLAAQSSEDPLGLLERSRELWPRHGVPTVAVVSGEYSVIQLRIRDQVPELAETGEVGIAANFRVVQVVDGDDEDIGRSVAAAALEALPEQALALGRRFPAFRATVSERLILEASRTNAQFALLSSLPANVPVVGGLAAGGADVLLLTKNQALLVFKLAGIHGRDLHDRVGLAVEIAPVVGGAFLWRTVARGLLGMLPTVVGGLPKAAVAYVGTYVVGQLARYYYSTGRRPPPGLATRFQTEGVRLARELATRLRRRAKDEGPKTNS
jgi:uncharacterized protein (DUF697 family)